MVSFSINNTATTIALTKKLLDKTRNEWEECLRRKREEYAEGSGVDEVPSPVIDESYIK